MFAVLPSLLLSGARLSCTDYLLTISQTVYAVDFNLGFFFYNIGFEVPVFNVIQVLFNLVKGISDLNRPFQII